MFSDSHLLIIGGDSRNIGKTTLALKIIEKINTFHPITGLKVSAIRKGENNFHGNHPLQDDSNDFLISMEDNSLPTKDTSRMLKAGAKAAFFIQSKEEHVLNSFLQFKKQYYTSGPVICESRSLRLSVKPSLFIFLTGALNCKNDIHKYLAMADYVYDSSKGILSLEHLAKKISYDSSGWHLNDSYQ